MPPPPASYLFDLLAPRLFRSGASAGRQPRGGIRRASSAVALHHEEGVRQESDEEQAQGGGDSEERAIAGPSRPGVRRHRLSRPGGVYHARKEDAEYSAVNPYAVGCTRELPAHIPIAATLPRMRSSPASSRLRSELYAPEPFRSHIPQRHPDRLAPIFGHPNPPPVSSLYPRLLSETTRSNGELLMRYARRMDDRRTETGVRDLLGRARIAPISWICPPPTRRRRYAGVERIQQEEAGTKQAFGSGDDPPSRPRVPLPAEAKRLRAASNTWARNMWPPTPPSKWGRTANDAHTFLCRQHHLLLAPSAPTPFIDALRTLEGIPGVKDRDLLSLLHLYLAYPHHLVSSSPSTEPSDEASPTPSRLLTPLHQLLLHAPHITPTRQTLHVLILGTFATSPSSPSSPRDLPPHMGTAPIVDTTGVKPRIRELLNLFRTQWGFSPACESYRHIMRLAILAEDKEWAKEAWAGWWSARERGRIGDDGDPGDGVADDVADDSVEGRDELELAEGDVIFRFRHRGRELARWFRVIQALKEKGWLRERDNTREAGTMGRERWEWVVEDEAVDAIEPAGEAEDETSVDTIHSQ